MVDSKLIASRMNVNYVHSLNCFRGSYVTSQLPQSTNNLLDYELKTFRHFNTEDFKKSFAETESMI